jgi:hypothetical protein
MTEEAKELLTEIGTYKFSNNRLINDFEICDPAYHHIVSCGLEEKSPRSRCC